MTTIDEMDEFVNWDNATATAATGGGDGNPDPNSNPDFDLDPSLNTSAGNLFPSFDIDPTMGELDMSMPMSMPMDPSLDNIDFVFANVDEDDFSFHALQHFSDNATLTAGSAVVPEMSTGMNQPADFWDTPEVPCANCTLGGFSCKRIREGRYKGFCTSCVALTVECSFGGVVPDSLNPAESTTLPTNPWSTMGADPSSSTLMEEVPVTEGPTSNRSSSLDLTNLANAEEQPAVIAPRPDAPPPKIGARFSRESVRILKTWLTTHNRHPYPSDEEKELLQRKTGLNKTQITNWLANARRRGKVQPPRSTSPHPNNWSSRSGPVDIPQRRGTPALETMNPLQRWEHSPPENEPASITAINRAVTASSSGGVSSGLNSPFTNNYTDDGSGRSLCNQSSASSLGTSQSSNGSSGAYSYSSRNSLGSFGSAPFNSRSRRRRRRKAGSKPNGNNKTELNAPLKTFQCTFCTETFRTKHDWQRHEKSLHLSLERWVCAPHGSRAISPETGKLSCVFCGVTNPDDAHIESHNHMTCQERSLEERTFYRKDHLNQHLRLVHNVKFMDWSMKSWKVATPEIRSRCGFCGIVMDTWAIRVDHLAEHFKTGYSMADWNGDWGFDVPVLDMVENAIPPYLIDHERTSPLPYIASQASPESPRNAYELLKLELSYFDINHRETFGRPPSDEELMVEGCRIIFASETLSLQGIATTVSWLRDLIMDSEELMHKARFGPLRGAAENRLAILKINGKDNLFEACPMESQLHDFVKDKKMLGLTAMDDELQEEACRIVGRVEEVSTHPSDVVANWLLRLITSSTHWLAPFRRRASLPRSEDVQDQIIRSTDPTNIDSTIHSYTRLERELADFLKLQRASGVEPSDEDLQREARIIIYEFDDGWNQTAADNVAWLDAFKNRHPRDGVSPPAGSTSTFSLQTTTNPTTAMSTSYSPMVTKLPSEQVQSPGPFVSHRRDANGNISRTTPFFLNDANCYRRLERELSRWVVMTMSPNNPNRHVPTDIELQHQARWILYDEDDPWNQTAADNVEWLQRFKRNSGILQDGGPGLDESTNGNQNAGKFPQANLSRAAGDHVELFNALENGVRMPPSSSSAGGKHSLAETACSRYARPTYIFCSSDLEDGLVEAAEKQVAMTGCLPTQAAMKTHARQILGAPEGQPTPADDPELMNKLQWHLLKRMPRARVPAEPQQQPQQQDMDVAPAFLDAQYSEQELDSVFKYMDFEFGGDDAQKQGAEEADGGVSLSTF